MQKTREKILSKLKKLGANVTATAIQNATDEQLLDLAEGLDKLRDYKLARFIVTLVQRKDTILPNLNSEESPIAP